MIWDMLLDPGGRREVRKSLLAIAAALNLILLMNAAAAAGACVDVALVLAIDGSDSIDDSEYVFQKKAIAAAFRDATVLAAMRDAGVVAVSAVFWGDGEFPLQRLEWFVVEPGRGAERFAREIEENARAVFGNTDIGSGIAEALDLLSDPDLCASNAVIDVSGDGMETLGPKRPHVVSLYHARKRAEELGVTINALVISDDGGALAKYYAAKVIMGANAFVMEVKSFADFSSAMRMKLIRELSYHKRIRRGNGMVGRV